MHTCGLVLFESGHDEQDAKEWIIFVEGWQ